MSTAADVRARIAAALDGDPDIAVLDGPVDSIEPPAYMIVSGDPWYLPATPCVYTLRVAVVCIAGRIEPSPGLETLEALVERAITQLVAARALPIVQVGTAGPFEVGGLQYLAARITIASPVTIGG